MKRALVLIPLAAFLAACDQKIDPAVPLDGAPAAQQPANSGLSPVTAGVLGAAAGYFLGSRRTAPAAVPAPTVVERHTVVVREVPRAAAPRVAPPPSRTIAPSPARVSAFRPSSSFGRRR